MIRKVAVVGNGWAYFYGRMLAEVDAAMLRRAVEQAEEESEGGEHVSVVRDMCCRGWGNRSPAGSPEPQQEAAD